MGNAGRRILVLALALGSLAGTTGGLDSAYYYPGEGPCSRLESWGAAEIAAFLNAAAGDAVVTAGALRRTGAALSSPTVTGCYAQERSIQTRAGWGVMAVRPLPRRADRLRRGSG